MTLTQEDFERHVVCMWSAPAEVAIWMIIGYSFAFDGHEGDFHDDCMFLFGVLNERGKLT